MATVLAEVKTSLRVAEVYFDDLACVYIEDETPEPHMTEFRFSIESLGSESHVGIHILERTKLTR